MSKTKFMKFRMGKMDILGVICSSNDMFHDSRNVAMQLKCEDKIYEDSRFDNIDLSNVIVNCPRECSKLTEAKVWGSSLFSWKSSICRAAIYS